MLDLLQNQLEACHQRLDLSRTQNLTESRLDLRPVERPEDIVELRAKAYRAVREALGKLALLAKKGASQNEVLHTTNSKEHLQ